MCINVPPSVGVNLALAATDVSEIEGNSGMNPTVEVCILLSSAAGTLSRDVEVILNTMEGTAGWYTLPDSTVYNVVPIHALHYDWYTCASKLTLQCTVVPIFKSSFLNAM